MSHVFKNDANKKEAEVNLVAINGNTAIHLIECKVKHFLPMAHTSNQTMNRAGWTLQPVRTVPQPRVAVLI